MNVQGELENSIQYQIVQTVNYLYSTVPQHTGMQLKGKREATK